MPPLLLAAYLPVPCRPSTRPPARLGFKYAMPPLLLAAYLLGPSLGQVSQVADTPPSRTQANDASLATCCILAWQVALRPPLVGPLATIRSGSPLNLAHPQTWLTLEPGSPINLAHPQTWLTPKPGSPSQIWLTLYPGSPSNLSRP